MPCSRARLALLAVLWAASATAAGSDDAKPADAGTEALRRETTLLEQELALAKGSDFYLRLDARHGRLALMLKGVTLDEYVVSSLERAAPRVLFVPRRAAEDWTLKAFSKGRLQPERETDRAEVVVAAPTTDATPSPPPIPQTAEEKYSVPSPYRIEFAEGLSLEITAAGSARNRSWLQRGGDWLRLRGLDWRAALSSRAGERVRLRAEFGAEDAAALYRSLPPDVRLLVVGLSPR